MTALTALKTAAAARDTDTLIGALLILEQAGTHSEEERLTRAAISDVIEERHGLTDALDVIYADEDYAGTYTEAILAALKASA